MTTRSLPRALPTSTEEDRGHNQAVLAAPGAPPVVWDDEHADPVLAAHGSSDERSAVATHLQVEPDQEESEGRILTEGDLDDVRYGDWIPSEVADALASHPTLIDSPIAVRIIGGVEHVKVINRPQARTSTFADDDDDPLEYTRRKDEREKREKRAATRKRWLKILLPILALLAAGTTFFFSPLGQELLTTTETVTVEVEKEKEYTGELLD